MTGRLAWEKMEEQRQIRKEEKKSKRGTMRMWRETRVEEKETLKGTFFSTGW